MSSRLSRTGPAIRASVRVGSPLALGLLLRLWFVHARPTIAGDPLIYGTIAQNLLDHGVYGLHPGAPTLIRLPGYPLFLAACFALFGAGQYRAVLFIQIAAGLLGCFLLSRLAARLAPESLKKRAAVATLWLAALCPFTASYTAIPLTETLELFATSVAFWSFARALRVGEGGLRRRTQDGLGSGEKVAVARRHVHSVRFDRLDGPGLRPPTIRVRALALSVLAWISAAMLRPDGALLGITLWAALFIYGARRRALALAGLSALACLLAFVPWTVRNWRTFHVFEPLAPRYATDPGEPTNPGFQRWTKTVCADLVCTSEVYWAADDAPIVLDSLPARAFDSPAQLRETAQLLADYNRDTTITPALDARFAALANQRIKTHPVRYYVGLPLLRLADMWLRPRTELFNMDLRWWRYRTEGADTVLAWALAALNFAYLALAAAGAWRRPPLLGVFAAFVLLRCALLLTLEAPEPRYTLECFPVLFVLGGIAIARFAKPLGRRVFAAQQRTHL